LAFIHKTGTHEMANLRLSMDTWILKNCKVTLVYDKGNQFQRLFKTGFAWQSQFMAECRGIHPACGRVNHSTNKKHLKHGETDNTM